MHIDLIYEHFLSLICQSNQPRVRDFGLIEIPVKVFSSFFLQRLTVQFFIKVVMYFLALMFFKYFKYVSKLIAFFYVIYFLKIPLVGNFCSIPMIFVKLLVEINSEF